MLDCGLDVSTLSHFLPLPLTNSEKFQQAPGWSPGNTPGGVRLDDELKEYGGRLFIDSSPEFAIPETSMLDMSEVDVILISNYHCMLALPFITEYTAFKGRVYATEPSLHIGKLYMDELVEFIERIPKPGRATKWKQPNILSFLPPPLRDSVNPQGWRQCYNQHDVESSLAKVHMVGFNEKLDIFGALEATAVSSGFCLGSCNWVIQSHYEKISYLSGSSTLTTHPKPMEQIPLRNSEILILSSLTQTPVANPDAMIGEFCMKSAMTLKNGGNVLVPCYPTGVTYDLFECLSGHLESCGLATVPMYFISPVANQSLQYSNIYAEWLSNAKSSRVYLPEYPFPHAELVKNNRLRQYTHVHDLECDLRTPCVVFTGHPSLRCGDVVHFIELWGKSSANTLIFTEPDFQYLDALAPYQPLAMKISYCPIDTSLNYAQANKLIRDLRPLHLVIPDHYVQAPVVYPMNADLVIEYDPPPVTYRRSEVLNLPIRRRYEQIDLDPELAATLVPTEIKPGVSIATVSSVLVSKDSKHTLKPLPKGSNGKVQGYTVPQPYVWGSPDVQQFVKLLKKAGIDDVKVEEGRGGGHIIDLPNEDTLIQIEEGSTHIICQGNEELRVKIRDTLLKCLASF